MDDDETGARRSAEGPGSRAFGAASFMSDEGDGRFFGKRIGRIVHLGPKDQVKAMLDRVFDLARRGGRRRPSPFHWQTIE